MKYRCGFFFFLRKSNTHFEILVDEVYVVVRQVFVVFEFLRVCCFLKYKNGKHEHDQSTQW